MQPELRWTEVTDTRPRRRAPQVLALMAFLLSMSVSPARAQNADAEILFNEASTQWAQGRVDEACDLFEGSNRLEPRAGTLLRLGECRVRQGRLASAWSAYRDAQVRAKDPKKLTLARQEVAAIEARLSYLTVSVPDEARIEGLEITRNGKPLDAALWNRAVPVDGGEYVIAGRAPGHEEWSTRVMVAIELGKVTIDVPRFKAIAKLIQPTISLPNLPRSAPDADAPPARYTGRRKVALGLAGVALAAGVGGLLLWRDAAALEAEAYRLCPEPSASCSRGAEANDRIHQAKDRQLQSTIVSASAGAATIGAVVLWLTGAPERPGRQTAVQLAPGYAGLTYQGRF